MSCTKTLISELVLVRLSHCCFRKKSLSTWANPEAKKPRSLAYQVFEVGFFGKCHDELDINQGKKVLGKSSSDLMFLHHKQVNQQLILGIIYLNR